MENNGKMCFSKQEKKHTFRCVFISMGYDGYKKTLLHVSLKFFILLEEKKIVKLRDFWIAPKYFFLWNFQGLRV